LKQASPKTQNSNHRVAHRRIDWHAVQVQPEHLAQLHYWPLAHLPCFARSLRMLPMISAMRCSFCMMLATSCSGGRCLMSSLALGFLRSRLQPLARISAADTFQACSFSFRPEAWPAFPHQVIKSVNSSNWIGAVLV